MDRLTDGSHTVPAGQPAAVPNRDPDRVAEEEAAELGHAEGTREADAAVSASARSGRLDRACGAGPARCGQTPQAA